MLRKSQISARSTGHIEAGAAERAEILLRPGRISAVIRSLGTGVLQVPPSDRHAACPIGTFLPADPQLTNWSFTWPRFQGGFPIFPRVPPFSSICKREAGVSYFNRLRHPHSIHPALGGGPEPKSACLVFAQCLSAQRQCAPPTQPFVSGAKVRARRCSMRSQSERGARNPVVLARFEQHAPASVMARTALEHALSPDWVDAVFGAGPQRQYSRELLFSTVVELMTLVSLGLRPSLHAAARQMDTLPVSLASLYDKVNHTEPGILQALVRGSAQWLAPVMARLGVQPGLPGYALRVLDGNHRPGSEKRLEVLRGHRGAALPGQSIVVYDPDSGLVTDMIAGEDAHQSERTLAIPLLQGAGPGQVWIADRHFCTRTLL